MKAEKRDPRKFIFLPDFCASRAGLGIVLIIVLTSLVLTLAHDHPRLDFLSDLARKAFFMLWIGVVSGALLCMARNRLRHMSIAAGSLSVIGTVAVIVAAVSTAAVYIGNTTPVRMSGASMLFPQELGPFLLRNVTIGLIVTALVLRYFYVTYEWRRNVQMQARARVHALQARIRPHFLYNSMNTIASLTRSDPALAEQAVQDLADLFRASLNEKRDTIRLEEEIEVARIYQRIEQLRLGDRLEVVWNIDALPARALVPSLTLQPLLENAIYHGIEPQPAGGTVTVSGEVSSGLITIVVRNPIGERQSEREGNRLALANIRERLALMYGNRALVKAGRFDDEYIVTLRFPHVEANERLTA